MCDDPSRDVVAFANECQLVTGSPLPLGETALLALEARLPNHDPCRVVCLGILTGLVTAFYSRHFVSGERSITVLTAAGERSSSPDLAEDARAQFVVQDIAHASVGTRVPRPRQRLGRRPLIAGFQVSINCRFWVSTEGDVVSASGPFARAHQSIAFREVRTQGLLRRRADLLGDGYRAGQNAIPLLRTVLCQWRRHSWRLVAPNGHRFATVDMPRRSSASPVRGRDACAV
jgi:hypothetical protein